MRKIIGIMVLAFITNQSIAQNTAARIKNFNIKKNVAIEGYDPVSYFDGKPLEGKASISYVHNEVTYHFANQTNLQKFKLSPEKYEPAYGGWCAYAMGETGEKVKIDPETFKIVDGMVNLFYNFRGNNTLKDWDKNEKALKVKSDQNWKKFIP
jgi:YHS domain-containing protein